MTLFAELIINGIVKGQAAFARDGIGNDVPPAVDHATFGRAIGVDEDGGAGDAFAHAQYVFCPHPTAISDRDGRAGQGRYEQTKEINRAQQQPFALILGLEQ